MSSLRGLLRKEIFHILRDTRTLAVVVLMPVVQVILFGFAIRTDVKDVRLAIVDPTPDHVTLEIRNRLEASETFRTIRVLRRSDELDQLFQKGTVQEAVVFEPGFADRLDRGLPARVQIIADAVEPNTSSTLTNPMAR
jgi:ABC-2 type transport system permease protein